MRWQLIFKIISIVLATTIIHLSLAVSEKSANLTPLKIENVEAPFFTLFTADNITYAVSGTDPAMSYESTNASHVINSCLKALPPSGGSLLMKAGTYYINGSIDTIRTNNGTIRITGEGRDLTLLRSIRAQNMINIWGNASLSHLTLDGNGIGRMLVVSGEPYYITLDSLRVRGHTGIGVWFGPVRGFSVSNCKFDNASGEGDQMAFDCTEYGLVINNYFDRTEGQRNGSCLTSGGGRNVLVSNNKINRTSGDICHGISLEPMTTMNNMDNFSIINNVIHNGTIRVGAIGQEGRVENIRVASNSVYGADIMVYCEKLGLSANIEIRDNFIESGEEGAGILVRGICDPIISNNTVSEGDEECVPYYIGLISVIRSENGKILNNTIAMSGNGGHTLLSGIFLRENNFTTVMFNSINPTRGRTCCDYDPCEDPCLTMSHNEVLCS